MFNQDWTKGLLTENATSETTSLDQDWLPFAFVHGTWAVLFLGALAFVWRYGSNVPWWDDWYALIPTATGKQPLTHAWLWAQVGPHRIALPKLVEFILFYLTGDLRAPMY